MDFASQPLFQMLSQRLNWLTERQKVLAENVANVDTPNYKPHDLKKLSFEQMVRGASATMAMARTDGKHISTAGGGGLGSNDVVKDKPIETTLSGNSVTLDTELMKLGQTSQDHALAINLYHDQLAMFRTVLGSGGGG